MSTGHTPTPWRLKDDPQHLIQAGGEPEDPYTVANCWSGPFAPTKAVARENARLIVRAVNAHAALVECLTEVLAWLRRPPGGRASEAMVAQALEKVLAYVEGR
jgi:hypothetical protein